MRRLIEADGLHGYEASDDGHIWRQSNWRGATEPFMLAESVDKDGYRKVRVYRDGVYVRASVHRLVALAFHGVPADDQEVRHLNGDPSDNRAANLRWGTRAENAADRKLHGTEASGDRHPNTHKTHCPKGHAYTDENTYRTRDGRRECRTCKRARSNVGRKR